MASKKRPVYFLFHGSAWHKMLPAASENEATKIEMTFNNLLMKTLPGTGHE
jgi:hypothetical protein